MLEIALLPFAGLFDRVRGGWPQGRSKWVKYPLMYTIGCLIMLQVTHTWWLVLAAGPLMAQGWRQDNGWRGRWVQWQRGIHTQSPAMIIHALRFGLLLPIFVMPLAYFEIEALTIWPACIIGVPLAMWISVGLPDWPDFLDLRNAWPKSELIEMPIIGLITGALAWAL